MENAKNITPLQPTPSRSLPSWITPAWIARTRAVWQPYVDHVMSDEDAIEMLKTIGALAEVLFEPAPLDNHAVVDPPAFGMRKAG